MVELFFKSFNMGTELIFRLDQGWPFGAISLFKLNNLLFGLINKGLSFKTGIIERKAFSKFKNFFLCTRNHLIGHADVYISLFIDLVFNTFLRSLENTIGDNISNFRIRMLNNNINNIAFFPRHDTNPTLT